MSFHLLEDRVAIIADEVSETTASGLYVTDGGQEVLRYGTVHSVGNGTLSDQGTRVPLSVQPGDRVFFNRVSGSKIEIEGEEYLFLAAREIIGVVE